MSEQDDAPEEREESEERAESEERKSDPERSEAPKKKSAGARTKSKKRATPPPPPPRGGSPAWMLAIAALAIGGAGGWFGHDAQAKSKLRADAAPAGSALSGPCATWKEKLCATSGEESAACSQIKGVAALLTSGTCEQALQTVPASLAKLKAARASCDKLVGKLCGDLPPGSKACDLVKERTPSFPSDRCTEMLENYDAVIGELRTLDQQMGENHMGGMGMPPPGMPPQGAPPSPPGAP